MKVVINTCYGRFGISQEGYAKLIEWGIPERPYISEPHDPNTGLVVHVPENEGEIIFNSGGIGLEPDKKYWEVWLRESREHPLLIRLVEELGEKANGPCAELKIVEIPDGTDYTIEEYDGLEHIAEAHATWS